MHTKGRGDEAIIMMVRDPLRPARDPDVYHNPFQTEYIKRFGAIILQFLNKPKYIDSAPRGNTKSGTITVHADYASSYLTVPFHFSSSFVIFMFFFSNHTVGFKRFPFPVAPCLDKGNEIGLT